MSIATSNIDNKQPAVVQYQAATVVGLGATGYSVVRYLRARGLNVTVVDSRADPALATKLKQDYPEVKTHFGNLNCSAVTNAELLVVSPGISVKEMPLQSAKANGAELLGDIELFVQENSARVHKTPLIAITGSNGKSTVTTLVGKMCEAGGYATLVAGNIGKPVLDALTDGDVYDIVVLELSSFQLETTFSLQADCATILNISEDHMDRYDSMGDYVLAKARILRGAKRAVLPRHEEHLQQITNINEVSGFALDEPKADYEFGVVRKKSGRWLMRGDDKLMLLRNVPLVGLHNVANVLSAFALVNFLDIDLEVLVGAVISFEGLPHRMQTVAKHAGVTWVNDSKATNVGATSTALKNLEGNVIWLAGGEGKGADFGDLRHAVTPAVKAAILFGADANRIADSVAELTNVKHVDTLNQAVEMAAAIAENGDVVLLSPACASFDMFDNFEHRGQVFAAAASSVAKKVSGGEHG